MSIKTVNTVEEYSHCNISLQNFESILTNRVWVKRVQYAAELEHHTLSMARFEVCEIVPHASNLLLPPAEADYAPLLRIADTVTIQHRLTEKSACINA